MMIGEMVHRKVQLEGRDREADGYVISLGPVCLVNVVTDAGMLGCGAFDVQALNGFGYPAAKVRSCSGGSIASIEDLLDGVVRAVNDAARERGLREGMTSREALLLL